MKNFRFSPRKIFVLTSLLAGLSITGCNEAQGSLHAINVQSLASSPSATTASTIPADTTAPVIDALDETIPYGSFLRLADIATITDDRDKSPVLEIVSVTNTNDKAAQSITASGETATTSTTETAATSSSTALEAVEVKPDENQGASDGSTEASAAAITSETAAEVEPDEPGYLFSVPGKYNMLLKGTDKSGNESTKTITVTVADKTIPVFDGLHESFVITDN